MEVFIFWIVFSVLVGIFAKSKGRSNAGFFALSLLISPLIAFIIALMLPPVRAKADEHALKSGELRKCPFCAELIRSEAIACKHCGGDLPSS